MTEPLPAHEETDVEPRAIVIFGICLLALVAATIVITVVVLNAVSARPQPDLAERSPLAIDSLPSGERLQVSPPADLRTFREAEDAALNAYGWVDRASGVVHIPIEVAKTMLLERGLPARNPPLASAGAAP